MATAVVALDAACSPAQGGPLLNPSEAELAKPAPAGSALVVSENYYPGWMAKADGKDAVVVRTDYSLMGVVLPPGATRVELTFTSRAYERGKMLTLLALALSIGAIAAGIVVVRRRRG